MPDPFQAFKLLKRGKNHRHCYFARRTLISEFFQHSIDPMPNHFTSTSAAADFIINKLGSEIRLATPLGLGKPNFLLNDLYKKIKNDSSKKFKIYTALSLGIPSNKSELAQRILKPFSERHWGKGYPDLEYYKDAVQDKIPNHIQVHEFYFQAGTAIKSEHLQRNYQSVNYTHVAENILRSKVNVVVQLISAKKVDGKIHYSLSCNPDLTLDVKEEFLKAGKEILIVGVVHPDLPFLEGDAEVDEFFFDAILEDTQHHHHLFALPRLPIPLEDHLIGFYSSLLVKDGGTLQIGIGSLSDTIVSSLLMRQKNNPLYLEIKNKLQPTFESHSNIFEKGLYGLTEMLTDGFMHLRDAGILKRTVNDDVSGKKTYLHGSFFLGSKPFYNWLKNLSPENSQGLRMTRVSKVNDLYDPQEMLLRKQRVHGRFFNTTMQVSLVGEAISETLPDAQVVSGVGGQFNFVSMSRELKDGLSVIMLRSTRIGHDGKRASNIIWSSEYITIPRPLRDIVVTEYGMADLRGKSDEDCIKALLNICDSQFQQDLLMKAQEKKKLSKGYQIPKEYQQNTPDKIQSLGLQSILKHFPFGSDFTKEEEKVIVALGHLQEDLKKSKGSILKALFKPTPDPEVFQKELACLKLDNPRSLKDKLYRKILLSYLHRKSLLF